MKEHPSFNVTKSAVECYKFNSKERYWAHITIDAKGNSGRIQISSDFGNWSYAGGACGEPFKKFLAGLDQDYVARNFGANKFFDAEATIQAYKDQAALYGVMTPIYRETMAEITRLAEKATYRENFIIHLSTEDGEFIMKMYDGTPEMCYTLDPGFKNFWEMIWPLLLEEFKKEEVPTEDTLLPIPPDMNLTIEYLIDEANIGKIFATGVITNKRLDPDPVRWIAKVGDGYHDWAIYYHLEKHTPDFIKRSGEKVTTESIIKMLVPCTDEAFKMYRF